MVAWLSALIPVGIVTLMIFAQLKGWRTGDGVGDSDPDGGDCGGDDGGD